MDKRVIITITVVILAGVVIGYKLNQDRQKEEDNIIREKPSELGVLDKLRAEQKLKDIDELLAERKAEQEQYNLLLEKSEVLVDLGRLEEATKPLKQAIELRSKTSNAYSDLFDIQLAMNTLDDAEETIETILDLNPTGSYWRKYIDFQRSKRNISNDEANELFQDALKAKPDDIILVTSYARFLEEVGDKTRAKEYWTIAGQKDPNSKAEYDAEISRIDGNPPPATNP